VPGFDLQIPCGPLSGGAGDDTLQGGAREDLLLGDEGNDLLMGMAGADRLLGGEGDDLLDADNFGARGRGDLDVLDGGPGVDSANMSDARRTIVDCEYISIDIQPPSSEPPFAGGPESAARVIQARGGGATREDLARTVRETGPVRNWEMAATGPKLVQAMNRLLAGVVGPRFQLRTRSSLTRMIDQLRAGRPVMALIQVDGRERIRLRGAPAVVPRLQWVVVHEIAPVRRSATESPIDYVRFIEPGGVSRHVPLADFASAFQWNFGRARNQLLESMGVRRQSFIA
jgi:hypothetical protein